MAWKAPKIVEVSVGMEINMYLCADPQVSGSESPSAIAGLSYLGRIVALVSTQWAK